MSKAQLAKQVVDDTDVARTLSSRDLDDMFRLEAPPTPAPGGNGAAAVATGAVEAVARDEVLRALLGTGLRGMVVRVTRHEDATAHDDSEELTKQEELEVELTYLFSSIALPRSLLSPSHNYPFTTTHRHNCSTSSFLKLIPLLHPFFVGAGRR